MATHRAIEATCQAVIELLRDNYRPADFNRDLEFATLTSTGVNSGLTAGVSLFLHRVTLNSAHRTPPGRREGNGRLAPQLPLDLSFVLTAWGQEASLQHAIAGWMMRTMEDHPVISSGLLNRRTDDVFRSDETVEITLAEMATEDMLHLWELLGGGGYQLSVPYLARNVRLESTVLIDDTESVRDRITHYGPVPQP